MLPHIPRQTPIADPESRPIKYLVPLDWFRWLLAVKDEVDRGRTRGDGSWQPPQIADASAAADSVYYSTTVSKLVYKDAGGTVRALY